MTRARVLGLTPRAPFRTRETVAVETEARFATSSRVIQPSIASCRSPEQASTLRTPSWFAAPATLKGFRAPCISVAPAREVLEAAEQATRRPQDTLLRRA